MLNWRYLTENGFRCKKEKEKSQYYLKMQNIFMTLPVHGQGAESRDTLIFSRQYTGFPTRTLATYVRDLIVLSMLIDVVNKEQQSVTIYIFLIFLLKYKEILDDTAS